MTAPKIQLGQQGRRADSVDIDLGRGAQETRALQVHPADNDADRKRSSEREDRKPQRRREALPE